MDCVIYFGSMKIIEIALIAATLTAPAIVRADDAQTKHDAKQAAHDAKAKAELAKASRQAPAAADPKKDTAKPAPAPAPTPAPAPAK